MSATSAALLSGSQRSASSISFEKGDERSPKALRSDEVAMVVPLFVGVERAAGVEVDGALGALGRRTLRRTARLRIRRRIDVAERRDLADVVEGLLAHASPKALHLAARRGVVGLRVQQRDAEARARELENGAAVRRAVVEVDRVRLAVLHERLREERQHRLL